MDVVFALIGEGRSDLELVEPVTRLLFRSGATYVEPRPIDLSRVPDKVGHSVDEKIRWVLQNEATVNLVLIHRDADRAGYVNRWTEIQQACAGIANMPIWVPVIPVKALETWVLVDEPAIRRAADNPNGRGPLNMPALNGIENMADPKDALYELIRVASETTGRRRKKLNHSLARRRSNLVRAIDIDGHIGALSSWRTFVNELNTAVGKLFV